MKEGRKGRKGRRGRKIVPYSLILRPTLCFVFFSVIIRKGSESDAVLIILSNIL